MITGNQADVCLYEQGLVSLLKSDFNVNSYSVNDKRPQEVIQVR